MRLVDAIFIQDLQRDGYYHKASQSFAVCLPVKFVGVVGDARRLGVRDRAAGGGDD
jgi:GMP synthase (glutamine-hydrolysing)